jgi:hypothetical protein
MTVFHMFDSFITRHVWQSLKNRLEQETFSLHLKRFLLSSPSMTSSSCYLFNVRYEGFVRQFVRISDPGQKEKVAFGIFLNKEDQAKIYVYCAPNSIVANQLISVFGKEKKVAIMCSKDPKGRLKALLVERLCSCDKQCSEQCG